LETLVVLRGCPIEIYGAGEEDGLLYLTMR
jgi:hypothetical protein